MRHLGEHDQDCDAAHEPGDDGIRNKLDEGAEAQGAEEDLERAGTRDAEAAEGEDLGDAESGIGDQGRDERALDEGDRSAWSAHRQGGAGERGGDEIADDRRDEARTDAELGPLRAERRERDHPERQREREAGDRGDEPPGEVAAQ